ncbi:hypothetical protein NMY22_g5746 [Coprinellus aureogranulatus]|nr:hypothetical protein NMY22_g5746 [Coprinellus aureogranulatus]
MKEVRMVMLRLTSSEKIITMQVKANAATIKRYLGLQVGDIIELRVRYLLENLEGLPNTWQANIRTAVAQSKLDFQAATGAECNERPLNTLLESWTLAVETAITEGIFSSKTGIQAQDRRTLLNLLLRQSFAYLRSHRHLLPQERQKTTTCSFFGYLPSDGYLPPPNPRPPSPMESMYTDRSVSEERLPAEQLRQKRSLSPTPRTSRNIGSKMAPAVSSSKARGESSSRSTKKQPCLPKRIVRLAKLPLNIRKEWVDLLHTWGLTSKEALEGLRRTSLARIEDEMIRLTEQATLVTRVQALGVAHHVWYLAHH